MSFVLKQNIQNILVCIISVAKKNLEVKIIINNKQFDGKLKAMLNEAIFLATCNATNVVLQNASKI